MLNLGGFISGFFQSTRTKCTSMVSHSETCEIKLLKGKLSYSNWKQTVSQYNANYINLVENLVYNLDMVEHADIFLEKLHQHMLSRPKEILSAPRKICIPDMDWLYDNRRIKFKVMEVEIKLCEFSGAFITFYGKNDKVVCYNYRENCGSLVLKKNGNVVTRPNIFEQNIIRMFNIMSGKEEA